MSELVAFLTWVAANAPHFIEDLQKLLKGWSSDAGVDPTPYLRAIKPDTHAQVDADITAALDAAYTARETPTKG